MAVEVGGRLRTAREAAGFSLRQLEARLAEEDRVDLGYTALHRIETGQRRLATHELEELARVLGTSPAVLLGHTVRSPALALAARVTAESGPAGDVAVRRAVQTLEAQDLLDRLIGPLPEPPELSLDLDAYPTSKQGRRRLAADLRAELGLGDGPVADLADLIEERFAAHVLFEPLPGGQHGFCVVGDRADGRRAAVIMVNADDDPGRQRFTLAHELAHLLVDDPTVEVVSDQTSGRAETLADQFAGFLLAPESGVRRALAERTVDAGELARLAHLFDVSVHAMAVRLSDYRIIGAARRDELLATGAGRSFAAAGLAVEWQTRQDKKGRNLPPRRLLAHAVQAYTAGTVGIGLVAEVLGTDSLAETGDWLRQHGFEPVGGEPVDMAAHV